MSVEGHWGSRGLWCASPGRLLKCAPFFYHQALELWVDPTTSAPTPPMVSPGSQSSCTRCPSVSSSERILLHSLGHLCPKFWGTIFPYEDFSWHFKFWECVNLVKFTIRISSPDSVGGDMCAPSLDILFIYAIPVFFRVPCLLLEKSFVVPFSFQSF